MKNKQIIQKIVLGGVVIKNNKVLILQRNDNEDIYPGMWELPSGKREPLEPSEESLIREIKEETGLVVEIIIPFSVFDYQIEKENDVKDSTQINFLVKIIKDDSRVILSDEHQQFAWVTQNEIEEYNLTDATKSVIEKAFKVSILLKL